MTDNTIGRFGTSHGSQLFTLERVARDRNPRISIRLIVITPNQRLGAIVNHPSANNLRWTRLELAMSPTRSTSRAHGPGFAKLMQASVLSRLNVQLEPL